MNKISEREKERGFRFVVYEDGDNLVLTVEKDSLDEDEKACVQGTVGLMNTSLSKEKYKEKLQDANFASTMVDMMWYYFKEMYDSYKQRVLALKESKLSVLYQKEYRERWYSSASLKHQSQNTHNYRYVNNERIPEEVAPDKLRAEADKIVAEMRLEDDERVYNGTLTELCPICRLKFVEIQPDTKSNNNVTLTTDVVVICPGCHFKK